MRIITGFGALCAIACLVLPGASIAADFRGVTATEIRIGQTMPYSGPVSAFGALSKGEAGYLPARTTLHLEMFCSVVESRAVVGSSFSRNG